MIVRLPENGAFFLFRIKKGSYQKSIQKKGLTTIDQELPTIYFAQRKGVNRDIVKKICSFIKSKKNEPGNWIYIMHPCDTYSCDAGIIFSQNNIGKPLIIASKLIIIYF